MVQKSDNESYQLMLDKAEVFIPDQALGDKTDFLLVAEASEIARKYVLESGGTYVEGAAFNDFPLPWMHAWVVKDGRVIDTYWSEPGLYYAGIPITDLSKPGPFLWQ